MDRAPVRRQIFLIFFLLLFLLVARLFYPFLTIILWSGIMYGLLDPVYQRLTRRRPDPVPARQAGDGARVWVRAGEKADSGTPGRKGRLAGPAQTWKDQVSRSAWAGILALLGVGILVVPVVFLVISLVKQVGEIAGNLLVTLETQPEVLDLSPSGKIGGFIARLSGGSLDLSGFDIMEEVKHILSASSGRILGLSGQMLKSAFSLGLTLVFMVFTLYFMFVDGRHLARMVVKALPIERTYTRMFLAKLRESGRQLVLGFFVVAMFQSVMMFILCLVFAIPKPLVLASLTAVASFVPMAGTALIWMPLALIIALSGNVAKAVIFAVCAGLLVSSLDNFLRPLLLGERLKIHPLLIFFSILGGLSIFGFNGLVLGPLILIIFFSAVELYDSLEGNSPGETEDEGECGG